MKELEELAKGFIETTEKATALERLWEENSKFSGKLYLLFCFFFLVFFWLVWFGFFGFFLLMGMCFLHIKTDLNEVEEIISTAENLYKQPYIWNLLHSLPHLELKSFYTEDELAALAQFLKVIQNTLTSLKDLAMIPFGQSFYEVINATLNLTAALLQDRSIEGFQYNLSLMDVLWNPLAVRAELESGFGFDDLHVEKLLNYTAQLTKV
ncbi:ABCAD protein, partial [Baryphthengus martii]|nr:ABCAD protein [Baryphthengus martii]